MKTVNYFLDKHNACYQYNYMYHTHQNNDDEMIMKIK